MTNISAMFDTIKQAIQQYQGSWLICGYACDAMVLGSLIKSLSTAGIWPIPEPPYEGVTFSQLVDSIEGLEIVSLCDKTNPDGSHLAARGHRLNNSFLEQLYRIEGKITGLEYQDI